MKQSLSTFILGALIISLNSCETKQETAAENLPKYEVEIIDSIRIGELGEFSVADYHETLGYYLAVASKTGDVLVLKSNGEVITKLNKIGEDPTAIGDYILGASFYKNNQVMLLGKRGLFFYNFDGVLSRKVTRKNKGFVAMSPQFKLEPFVRNGQEYVVCMLETSSFKELGTKATPKYYESMELITLIDLKNETFKEAVNYPKESIFRGEKCYYDQDRPIFDYCPRDSSLYFLFGFEDKLYRFHGDNFSQYETVASTQPTNIQMLPGEAFAKKPPQENVVKYTFLSGVYMDIFKNNDTTYTQYSTGIPQKRVDHNLSFQEYIELYRQFNKYYLQVFVNNKKMCADIVLPDKVSYVDHITAKGVILLHRNKFLLSNETTDDLFYVGKLSKK